MDARLQSLINDYKAAVLRAITELEASGIPRPATTIEWTCYDVPGRGELTNGGEYFIHGFGCAVRMPGTTVDFDFGDDGQIDGFDWYRLSTFAGSQLHSQYRIRDEPELRDLINAATDSDDLVYSGYILSYTRDSLSPQAEPQDGGEQCRAPKTSEASCLGGAGVFGDFGEHLLHAKTGGSERVFHRV